MTLAALGTSLALNVINRSYDRQLDQTASEPVNARRIDTFLERVSDIETVDQFVDDYEVFSFVMEAFDLEDQIFGKGMMKAMLKSDITDSDSLAARLTDPRFRELYVEMGFVADGAANPNTADPAWAKAMVDRFLERSFINVQEVQNADLGAVLHFRTKVEGIDSWYDVLKDKEVAQVLRTALGLPESVAMLDLDRQIEIYEAKMDLADLTDPDFVQGIERKFAAIADAEAALAAPQSSPILQLFQSNSQFAPVTLDIESLSKL